MIFSAKFDYHQIKTIGKKAYRMSSYKVTLNSELGKHITHFHTFLVRLGRYGTRMKVFDNVRKQTHLKSSPDLTTGVITRWNSDHLEQSIASENHSYLEIALKRMICPTDINSYFTHTAGRIQEQCYHQLLTGMFIINMNPQYSLSSSILSSLKVPWLCFTMSFDKDMRIHGITHD